MKKLFIAIGIISILMCLSLTSSAAYLGDVDGNGKVTAADARTILRVSAKLDNLSQSKTTIADVNGDDKITAADARIVLRMSAKLEALKESCKHNYSATEIQKQSCEKDGITEYKCSVCNYSYTDVKKTKGHTYSSNVIDQVTCTSAGKEILTCTKCNYTYTKISDALGHDFVGGTCYSVGSCSRCNVKQDKSSLTGHSINPKSFKCYKCNRILNSPESYLPAIMKRELVELKYYNDIGDPDTLKITEAFYCVGPFSGEPDVAYFYRIFYEYRSPRNYYRTGVVDIYLYEYSDELHIGEYGYGSGRTINWTSKARYEIDVDNIKY